MLKSFWPNSNEKLPGQLLHGADVPVGDVVGATNWFRGLGATGKFPNGIIQQILIASVN